MTPIIGPIEPRARRLGLAMAAAALILPTGAASGQSAGAWVVSRPYTTQAAGIGGGDVVGAVRIAPGTERAVASRALVRTLEQMHLSIVSPQLGVDGALPAKRQWASDTVPLPRELVDAYNQAVPQLALPNARYGLQYKGEFDVAYGEFRYRISAQLFERSSHTNWRRVADSRYAGDFFVKHLAGLLDAELARSGVPR